MKRSFFAQLCSALCFVSLVSTAFAQSGWTTHNDPAGFAVDLPAAWTVAKDPASGRIIIRGTRGEQAMIWPLSLQNAKLDAHGAGALLQKLAHNVDAQMPWGSAQPVESVVRVIASNGQRSGAAVLSWANGISGTSIYLYCMEAPAEIYRASTDSFVRILKTFHVVQDPSMRNLPGAANSSGAESLSFVNWNDPHEGAFSVAVPQGWQVIGGAYRLSATDVRYALATGSPDGQGFAQPSAIPISASSPNPRRCWLWQASAKAATMV
jgi:hypothetical protein